MVRIGPELHQNDSPTYSPLRCQACAWEPQLNTRIACLNQSMRCILVFVDSCLILLVGLSLRGAEVVGRLVGQGGRGGMTSLLPVFGRRDEVSSVGTHWLF